MVMSQRCYSSTMREVPRWRFKGERELGEEKQSLYQSIIGHLNWLVQHSRTDLAVGVNVGSKKLQGVRNFDEKNY